MERMWYALQLRSRWEFSTASILEHKGYEVFLPRCTSRRKWSDRVKSIQRPLFPGYLFCRIEGGVAGTLVTTPGVIRIVCAGQAPLPVDREEIDSLRLVVSQQEVQQLPFCREGQKVEINTGPLQGARGAILQVKGQCKLVVSISILQRSVAVEIDGSTVSPVHTTRAGGSSRVIVGNRPPYDEEFLLFEEENRFAIIRSE